MERNTLGEQVCLIRKGLNMTQHLKMHLNEGLRITIVRPFIPDLVLIMQMLFGLGSMTLERPPIKHAFMERCEESNMSKRGSGMRKENPRTDPFPVGSFRLEIAIRIVRDTSICSLSSAHLNVFHD